MGLGAGVVLLFERDRKGTIIGGGYCSKKQEGKNTRGGLLFLKRTTGEGQSKGWVVEQQTYPVRSERGGGRRGWEQQAGGEVVVLLFEELRGEQQGRGGVVVRVIQKGKHGAGWLFEDRGVKHKRGGGCCSPNWGTTTLPPPPTPLSKGYGLGGRGGQRQKRISGVLGGFLFAIKVY